MNTKGHEDVAKAAGIPLLEEFFGKDKRSLQAFYLGNWLTDVSQAVDPVAYWAASSKGKHAVNAIVNQIKKSIDALLDENFATIYDWFDIRKGSQTDRILKSVKPDIEPFIDNIKNTLHQKIDFLVAIQKDERDSRLARFFRASFLVIGYFKFVHPESAAQEPRMNFECFMQVFGRSNDVGGAIRDIPANDRPGAYTQYYPHEHVDRPEILPPQDPPIFAPGPQTIARPFPIAYGKLSGTRSPRRQERINPDLYSYLRDYIEMISGLLSELDLEFQHAFAEEIRDDDPRWHITLAKLGHAMHQVEDFFAHSNWTELAAKHLGPTFLSKAIPPNLPLKFMNRTNTTYQKRLKRHLTTPLDDWRSHPNEDWVVTGYFDFRDTLISLAHITEELWGGHVPDPYSAGYDLYQEIKEKTQHPKTILFEAQKIMEDTLNFLTDPKEALNNRENSVAKYLKDKFEPDINKLRRPGVSKAVAEQIIKESEIFHNAPKEVKDNFLDVIVEGTRVYTLIKIQISIYEMIREISLFIKSPVAWIIDRLKGVLKKKVIDALKFYVKERVYDWIGAERIGCHSLLAKDHGLEPFYKYQKECAMAVHWYIIKTLGRWASKQTKAYIDWLELLEYFLRNPLPPDVSSFREVQRESPVTIIHTVIGGEQLSSQNPKNSLEYKYRGKAVNPSTFTWRTIADFNFGTYGLPLKQTQQVINNTLRDRAWGVPVTPPNYAFKAGLRVLIPYQKVKVTFLLPVNDSHTWFEQVFENGWKVFKGYEDPKTGQSYAPLQHHTPVFISLDELHQLITQGKKLRRISRETYRPSIAGAK